ncbi:MAG: B12-binding domain-containing radical SAM protein, partial [Promethearchaeota archaeon]
MNNYFLDLLMVFPSGGDVANTRFNYHLGSAYIIAYLRENGFSAEQFISNEMHNVDECAKKILKLNPKIVGFTVYEKNYMQCVLISNQLKYNKSDIIIIFGGPTPTSHSKEIIESNKSVDLCVRREGEETVLQLLYLLSESDYNPNHVDFHEINGITFRDSNGTIITPENNVLFSNRLVKNYLDKYPSPYLTNVIPVSKAHPIGIITARGCNQNCIYCNCAILSKRNLYFHSIERVIEELSLISEYKKFEGPIPIYDDGFTIIPERAKKICEAILENDINLSLLCATRCDKISKELLDLMKEAGFESVGFSLESAVPKVLRAIGKVTNPSNLKSGFEKEIEFINKFKEMTSYAKKIGFKSVFVSIMIGLPGESPQDAQKTIDFLENLNIDVYAHNILHIYKGTPIYQNKEKYRYIVNSIGPNNNVILKNTFPFDVKKIRYGKKCAKIVESRNTDYGTLKTLSLKSRRESLKSFFEEVVINTNLIK